MRTVRPLLIAIVAIQLHSSAWQPECVKYHKRARVRAVCGRVTNPAGEFINGAELSLISDCVSSPQVVKSDAKGRFEFTGVPKGNYTLHATSRDYHVADRDIEVISAGSQQCEPAIEIQLGFDVCDTGVFVRGVDKPSDLDSERGKGKSPTRR